MTFAGHNDDLVPTQKLEWVTPKISLMGAGDTDGIVKFGFTESKDGEGSPIGPS